MFYARAFNNLSLWVSSPDFDSVPNAALDDWKSSNDGAFSFYLTESDKFLNQHNTNIAIKIICDGRKAWQRAIGFMFFDQNTIDSIKKPKQDKTGPLGTIHCNMESINKKLRNALEELSFNERNHSHDYSLEEIASAMTLLSVENWASLFDSKGSGKSDIIKSISNTYFREGGIYETPPALIEYCNK